MVESPLVVEDARYFLGKNAPDTEFPHHIAVRKSEYKCPRNVKRKGEEKKHSTCSRSQTKPPSYPQGGQKKRRKEERKTVINVERGQQKGEMFERKEVNHKIFGHHNQGNANMEIVCTPGDVVLRLPYRC